ncbi:hypothetical protein [Kordia sp.]|uniref:hypothetical protein n=1 Tax=Kordia sp. TaxID=1965332 RepID=UPI003D2A3E08
MSKKSFDKFLGKKTKSPLNTDIIYGGAAAKNVVTVVVVVKVVVVVVVRVVRVLN